MSKSKIIREIVGHFYTSHTQENALPHRQWFANTTRKTSTSQSLPSQSGEGNVGESHVDCDVMNKAKLSRKKSGSVSGTQAMYSKDAQKKS